MANEIITEALIYHGPGCCPKCGGPLTVVDHEMTIMELNQDGCPISEDTVLRCKAACTHCGHKQDMMRWKGDYIPYSETSKILKCAEAYDEMQDRIHNINLSSKGKNPFSLED